ncbi:MAG: YiiD C-terminal domain-containing protein [Parachlamydia sp.]|jgi:ribosomal-protein-alanine N-acetyltransferase|nr:YiiD C-terminal domain-containing protein [Parachlamydia sp.]
MEAFKTTHLLIRLLKSDDLIAIQEFEQRNREHLSRWETESSLSLEESMNAWVQEGKESRSFRYLVFLKDNPLNLIGLCNFTQIYQGAFQACTLGYKIDKDYEGRGLLFEALSCLLEYLFSKRGLHRVMANYMPVNERSARLLQRLRFEKEGCAKNYLLINGKWEDHILTALTFERWQRETGEKQLEDYLHGHIPISQAMGITVEEATFDHVILKAPFQPNINHKKTVFGRSLHAVLTLACWSLLHLHLKDKQIVITDSQITYLAPVTNDFKAICQAPDRQQMERLIKTLH